MSLKVVAGIVENQAFEILLAERPKGKHLAGLWEFPGGKIEASESAEAALLRELKEELDLDISINQALGVFPYRYEFGAIELHVFRVSALNTPRSTRFVENFRWLKAAAVDFNALAPADHAPLRAYLQVLAHARP